MAATWLPPRKQDRPPALSERIDNIRASLGPIRERLNAEDQGDRSTAMWVAVMVADDALREATRQLAIASLTLGVQEDLEPNKPHH